MNFNTEAAQEIDAYFEELRSLVDEPLLATNTPSDYVKQRLGTLGVVQHGAATTVPWLSKEVCDTLINLADRSEYEVNEEEPLDAQIPERVLAEHHPEEYMALAEAFFRDIEPIVQAVIGLEIASIESIQLAVYEADGDVPSGTYHTDEDSDVSVTIALNDDYEGGGLHVLTGGIYSETLELPKQAAGVATIFGGRMHVHKGLPVTSGKRHLLVFWCKV